MYRVHKNKNYFAISKYHLQDKLSLRAKGLLSIMLSLPDDWEYSISGLVSITNEKQVVIEKTLKELKDKGYLIVNKLMPSKETNGRIKYDYDVYEVPLQELERQGYEIQEVVKQGLEKQRLEKQYIEKQGLNINTNNNTINKEQNNKNINNLIIDIDNNIEKEKGIYKKEKEEQIGFDLIIEEKENNTQALTKEKMFDEFWKLYPKKIAKTTAYKSFMKIKNIDIVFNKIIGNIKKRKLSKEWQDIQFIPYPSTYLNQERWNDEVETKEPDWLEDYRRNFENDVVDL